MILLLVGVLLAVIGLLITLLLLEQRRVARLLGVALHQQAQPRAAAAILPAKPAPEVDPRTVPRAVGLTAR